MTASGRTVTDAVNDAWSAFDQGYQFASTYRVPRQWSILKVRIGLAGVVKNIDKMDILLADAGSVPIQADYEHRMQQTHMTIQNGGIHWITNGPETGVLATYENGQPVLTKDGKPLEVLFDDAVTLKYGGAQGLGRFGQPALQ